MSGKVGFVNGSSGIAAEPGKGKSLSRIAVLTSRNIKEIVRDPLSLVFTAGMPVVMELLFYFLFHNLTSQFGMNFLAPGIAVFAQAFTALFIGALIASDRGSAFLVRLYVCYVRSYEFIVSYILAALPVTALQFLLFFAVGGIIDPSIVSVRLVPVFGVCVFTSLFYISMGILFGALCNDRSIGGVSSSLIVCQSVLSGMWFPVEGLSGGMLRLMDILPFRNAMRLVQNTLDGSAGTSGDSSVFFAVVLVYTVIAFAGAVFVFRRKMKG